MAEREQNIQSDQEVLEALFSKEVPSSARSKDEEVDASSTPQAPREESLFNQSIQQGSGLNVKYDGDDGSIPNISPAEPNGQCNCLML